MTHPIRRLLMEGTVALVVCAAAYAATVRPMERSLREVSAKYSALVTKGGRPTGALSRDELQSLRMSTIQRKAALQQLGEHARDEARIFASIMSLASQHGVRVDQVRPAASARDLGAPAANSASPASGSATDVPRDVRVAYTLSVAGSYSGLAAFIEGLSADTGLSVVHSVRITPDDHDHVHPVTAQIETEHFAFDVSSVSVSTPAGVAAPAVEGTR